jgi:glycosyltransferase involved in cell wall biosynthesis
MLRVAVFRPSLTQGGADRVTVTLLRYLDRARFSTSLVLVRAEGEFLPDVPSDVTVHCLGTRRLATATWALRRYLRTERPDVLFSSSGGGNIPAVFASLLAGRAARRLVLSERSVMRRGGIVRRAVEGLIKALTYRFADEVTAVSEGVRNELIGLLRLAPSRVRVVYNPVVTPDILALAAEPAGHPWFNDGVPVVLGAGRFVPQKDFATLIRAFAKVREHRPARLVLLGEGPLRRQLEQLADQLDLRDSVWMPGFDKNPFRYMSRCSVFVLSSRFEGLPGVLIQAMACGCPVVSTDCPAGPAEIIASGVSGFLVPVGDVAALADRIAHILDHPGEAQQMGVLARRTAERFTVDRVLGAYEAALTGTDSPSP